MKIHNLLNLVAYVLFAGSTCFAATDVEFVIDLSGSMTKKLDGVRQVDHARSAFAKAVGEFPAEAAVGVRVFAHRVAQSDKNGSCRDTELLHPLAPLKAAEATLKLAALEPRGYTPIAYSLEQAGKDFSEASKERESTKVIVLLSDGEETCGGDPVEVLRKLREQGIEIIVHAIGFNVDEVTRRQLEEIARFSGGKYFDARNAGALSSALSSAAREVAAIPTPTAQPTLEAALDKKDELLPGQPVRGGDGYSSAVPLTPAGLDMKLDHHQDRQKFDFFYLDLKAGDLIEGSIRTGTKGGAFVNGMFRESVGTPGGVISIHGPNQEQMSRGTWLWSSNKINHSMSNRFFVPADGRYFVLVGAESFALNKEHFSFRISVSRAGDLDTGDDAGSSIATALPIAEGSYQKTFGGLLDLEDWFKLSAKKGEKYQFSMSPEEESSPGLEIEVYDALKIRMRSQRRGEGGVGQGMQVSFSAPEDGDYFIKVRYKTSGNNQSSFFSVSLKKEE